MKIAIISIYLLSSIFTSKCEDRFEATLGHITKNSRNSSNEQAIAVQELIQRILPNHTQYFTVIVDSGRIESDGKDFFTVKSLSNETIEIFGTTGVAAATGINYYLKYYCECHIGWQVEQLNMPKRLPPVDIKIVFNDRFRYYQNVCTTSYSFVWWNWSQWEKHIDWIVMNAFNLVLASNGQEAIWMEIYQEFGLTQEEIDDHFTGPAFLSWLRMGNVRKWGGPLPSAWHSRSILLQQSIVKRLRNFGVVTVLPGFAGHVPRAFKRLYPNATIVQLKPWNNFNDSYCCLNFLDPTEYLFQKIGKMFIQKQISRYGTDHVYNCDSFNENTPPSTDLNYLSDVSRSIYAAMKGGDDQAIWLMQNWLFVHDPLYWSKERAKALLTSVPLGRMIILDLQSEQFPQYFELDQYFGQPYIWCMLHNFGGTLGMYGSSGIINEWPIEARNATNSTMIGTGLTMEGINQNYVIYDLMTETAWLKEPVNLTQWFINYSFRRYGRRNQDVIHAWKNLQKSVYNLNTTRRMRGQYAITRTPTWTYKPWVWYDINKLFTAADEFHYTRDNEIKQNEGFRHDALDLYRQAIQVFNDQLYSQMKYAFKRKKLHDFKIFSGMFIEMLKILDAVLSTNKAFSLHEWVRSARAIGFTTEEKDWYEYNARNQISLWGPNGEIMNYAIKQWSGVVSDFILPRWRIFIEYSTETLSNKTTFNDTYIRQKMFEEAEQPFTFQKLQPPKANDDRLTIFKKCDYKWKKIIDDLAIFKKQYDMLVRPLYETNFRNLLRVVSFLDEDEEDDITVDLVK